MRRRDNRVHTASRAHHGSIAAGAAKIDDQDSLIRGDVVTAGIVRETGRDGLVDYLQDFEVSGFGSGDKRGTLGICEIGGHGNYGTANLGTEEIEGRFLKA